jgi:hypothetical protein
MNATQIERTPFAEYDDAMVKERYELAKKASAKLGYKVLTRELNPASNLFAALKDAGIEPLSRLAVERYKISKEKVYRRFSSHTLLAWWVFGVVPILGLLIANIYRTTQLPFQDVGFLSVVGVIASGLVCLVTIVGSCIATWGEDAYRTPRRIRFWQRYKISEYPAAIPEFVLQRALAIQARCAVAEFYVDHLVTGIDQTDANAIQDRKERIMRSRDPFLVAVTKDESYYVDVWDEKDYERTL